MHRWLLWTSIEVHSSYRASQEDNKQVMSAWLCLQIPQSYWLNHGKLSKFLSLLLQIFVALQFTLPTGNISLQNSFESRKQRSLKKYKKRQWLYFFRFSLDSARCMRHNQQGKCPLRTTPQWIKQSIELLCFSNSTGPQITEAFA